MLSTLSISLPANLYFFFRFGLYENLSGGGTTSRSAIVQTCYIRCSSFPDGLSLLVHFRLYNGINVHFFVLKLIFHVVFSR